MAVEEYVNGKGEQVVNGDLRSGCDVDELAPVVDADGKVNLYAEFRNFVNLHEDLGIKPDVLGGRE